VSAVIAPSSSRRSLEPGGRRPGSRTARHLMSYLGLVPSEHSSGSKQRRGPITKAGDSHLRRVLIEVAWLHGV
jgi:transposase